MGQLLRHACVSRQDASLGRAVVAHFAELTVFLFCFVFFVNHSFDFRPNRTPFFLITIINHRSEGCYSILG